MDRAERLICGLKILSREQIQNMSRGTLLRYARRVHAISVRLHSNALEHCSCWPDFPSCYSESRKLSGEEEQDLKTIDWLNHTVRRAMRALGIGTTDGNKTSQKKFRQSSVKETKTFEHFNGTRKPS